MKHLNLLSLALLTTLSTGCMTGFGGNDDGGQTSPEALELIRVMTERMKGGMPAQAVAASPTEQKVADISEADLLASIHKFPSVNGITLTSEKDGFTYDGKRYVDPEGRITKYQYDTASGDVTYLIKLSSDKYRAKYVRPGTAVAPVHLGDAQKANDEWTFRSVTGKTLTGDNILPSSRGMVVKREDSAFYYTPGSDVQTITIPSGYRLADFQRGDIGKTGYLLIEKLQKDSILTTIQDIGSTVGLTKKEDYALYNYSTQKLVPLNISLEGKKTSVYTDCRPSKKKVAGIQVNKCDGMESYESIWTAEGGKNPSHYYWLVDWQKGKKDIMAIVLEDSRRNLNALELETNKKVNLKNSVIGIYGFSANQLADGTINVKDEDGLTAKEYADIEALSGSGQQVVN